MYPLSFSFFLEWLLLLLTYDDRQTDLWGEVQSKITTLSDQMLEESFEVTVTKAKLKEDEKHLKDVLEKFRQQEELFRDAANVFSRPIW